MKKQSVTSLSAIVVSFMFLAVYGCGGGGGGGGSSAASTPTTTTVSTSAQAQSAGSASTSSTSLSAGVGNTLSNIAAPLGSAGIGVPKYKSTFADKDPAVKMINDALEKAVANNAPLIRAARVLRSKALATGNRATPIQSNTSSCANGGTVTYSGSYDGAATPPSFNMAVTFLDCKEDNQRNTGVMYMTGTFSGSGTSSVTETFTMDLGASISGTTMIGNFTSDFFSNNYTVLTGKLETNMSVGGTSTVATTTTTTFTANGTMNYTDFLNAGQIYTITLTNLKETMSSSSVSSVITTTSTVNGSVKEDWTAAGTAYSVGITFTDLALIIASASTYEDITSNGKIAITTTPTTFCSGGGTFVIATTTAVRYDKTLNRTTAGRQTINTDQVVIVWNADGSISVSLNGGTPTDYANESAFQSNCSFADLPTNTGGTTTTLNNTTTTDTTGSSLTATLTWQNSASSTAATNSDMDLHLKYYNTTTTPVANPTPTWYIDFTNKSVAIDSTHTGELDYDMCVVSCPSGTTTAGPEHITMQSLPQGYYVLSVNSFALQGDPGAVLTVTLQIGSNTYTFPTPTLAADDYNETSYSTAWYRVTDILVDGTGVHLKPADTAVIPAPPLSLRAPKVKL